MSYEILLFLLFTFLFSFFSSSAYIHPFLGFSSVVMNTWVAYCQIQFSSIKQLKQSERQIQNCWLVYSKNTTVTTFHTTHPYICRADTHISCSHYALVTVYQSSQQNIRVNIYRTSDFKKSCELFLSFNSPSIAVFSSSCKNTEGWT